MLINTPVTTTTIQIDNKQPRVDLPKGPSKELITSEQHVDTNNNQKVDISYEPIVTPTADMLLLKEETEEGMFNFLTVCIHSLIKKVVSEQKESGIVYSTEQPNVTPTMTKKKSNTSDSSFVVVKSNDNENTADDINKNEELLNIISSLKVELENEKATVNVLQKQKEGKIESLTPSLLSLILSFSLPSSI